MSRIKELREQRGISMRKAAEEIGIPYTTYVNYEKGEREPNSEMLIVLANYFSVSIDYLLGRSDSRVDDSLLDTVNEIDDDILEASGGNLLHAIQKQKERNYKKIFDNIIPLPKTKKVPLIGTIACGEPILAVENIDSYINMAEDINADFALKCKGDSMINARIFDGDYVYIRTQEDVDDGEIAAVLIGDEATLKRVHKYPGKLVLSPCNPMYNDLVYRNEELNSIRILGKAVAFLSAIR